MDWKEVLTFSAIFIVAEIVLGYAFGTCTLLYPQTCYYGLPLPFLSSNSATGNEISFIGVLANIIFAIFLGVMVSFVKSKVLK